MTKDDRDKLYMDFAVRISEESYCERAKVGAIMVSQTEGIFAGFNGTLPGFPNVCELHGKTNNGIVTHAEQNALYKMLKQGVSAKGAALYATMSPCEECAKMMVAAEVERVVFLEAYRDTTPLATMIQGGIFIEQFDTASGLAIPYNPQSK